MDGGGKGADGDGEDTDSSGDHAERAMMTARRQRVAAREGVGSNTMRERWGPRGAAGGQKAAVTVHRGWHQGHGNGTEGHGSEDAEQWWQGDREWQRQHRGQERGCRWWWQRPREGARAEGGRGHRAAVETGKGTESSSNDTDGSGEDTGDGSSEDTGDGSSGGSSNEDPERVVRIHEGIEEGCSNDTEGSGSSAENSNEGTVWQQPEGRE
ncbi:hypothetical protein EDB89DRAFT_1907753 [Lactarius sanguifluus]|nr:hypothetical protein EDB89DRAFT_1907753 [Lactarius sanguifluus]